jgi:hypothetical protein
MKAAQPHPAVGLKNTNFFVLGQESKTSRNESGTGWQTRNQVD